MASQFVRLDSGGVVCVIMKALDALLCVCVCMLVLTGGVAHLDYLISVSPLVASQWVWLDSVGVVCVFMKALDALCVLTAISGVWHIWVI